MKKYLFGLFFLIFLLFYFLNFIKDKPPKIDLKKSYFKKLISSPSPKIPKLPPKKTVIFENKKYSYALIQVNNKVEVQLISNLENKLSAQKMLKGKCNNLVSAGFYSKEYKHLGLFFTEKSAISSPISSELFNAYLIFKDKYQIVSSLIDYEETDFALQSGPLLMENGIPWNLSIINDEKARRIFAGISQINNLYFGVVYDLKDHYEGPLLSHLPEIVKEIGNREKIYFKDALNLDGGNASAFFSEEINLTEFTTVGGFFCLN